MNFLPSPLAQPYFSNLEFYIDQELDYECNERCQITTTNLSHTGLIQIFNDKFITPHRPKPIIPFNYYFKKPSNLPSVIFHQIITKLT